MTTLNLGKIRMVPRGEWAIGTSYSFLDLVQYGSHSYVFIGAAAVTGAVPSTDSANWRITIRGLRNRGVWAIGTAYRVGELVIHGPRVYQATADNTGSKPPSANWALYQEGVAHRGGYSGAATYKIGELVSYRGSIYICTAEALANLPTDTSKWDVFLPGQTSFSTTSLLIAAASKAFTIGTGFAYSVGNRVRAASIANVANYMEGEVTGYSTGVLTILVDKIGGSGTFADWELSVIGTPGTNGTNGTGYLTSSVTSLLIAAASKAFTVATGLAYTVGARARASSIADPANYMEGPVASYTGGVLTLTVDKIGGSGTFADWQITLVGEPGTTPPARITGVATLVGGTVTVNNASVGAGSFVFHSRQVVGGTVGDISVSKVNGVSFTLTSDSATDTSTVAWELMV